MGRRYYFRVCAFFGCALLAHCGATPRRVPTEPAPSRPSPEQVQESAPETAREFQPSSSERALSELPAWLDAHGPRSFSRTQVAEGVWLIWLQAREESQLCLDLPGEALRCWEESGQVTRVIPYGWAPEAEPMTVAGYVAVFRDRARTVFSAVQSNPTLRRAFARSQPLLLRARPSWWRSPYALSPRGDVPTPQWRTLPTVEANVGPLRLLSAESLHVHGRGRVAERDDAVVVARAGGLRRVCVRQERWTCSALRDDEGEGEVEYLNAFDLDGTSVALTRSHRVGADEGRASLEVWQREETLALQGTIPVGRAEGANRALHQLRVEADGCIHFDLLEHGSPALPPAPDRLSFEEEASFANLEGSWRLESPGFVRVPECAAGRVRLVVPDIPEGFDERGAACLAILHERVEELPLLPPVSGNACGAREYDNGQVMGRRRYRYDEGRLVETLRVHRLLVSDETRYVERERFLWRRGRRIGSNLDTFHFVEGQEECANRYERREVLDGLGRPTRIRSRSERCEGEARPASVERRRWRRGTGFDAEGEGADESFHLPSYADSSAVVSCTERRCSCHLEVEDESGRPRLRLTSGQRNAYIEYVYGCPSAPWPQTQAELGAFSSAVLSP